MKRKNFKGFTLIELIVVMAIIAALALILVPVLIGFIRDSNVSRFNANARSVYSGSQLGVVQLVREGGDPIANSVYLKAASGNEAECASAANIKVNMYLGDDFKGYFGFKIDSAGTGVEYAVWSNQPLTTADIVKLSDSDVETSMTSGLPRGCYPRS